MQRAQCPGHVAPSRLGLPPTNEDTRILREHVNRRDRYRCGLTAETGARRARDPEGSSSSLLGPESVDPPQQLENLGLCECMCSEGLPEPCGFRPPKGTGRHLIHGEDAVS